MRVVYVTDPPQRLDARSDSTVELMRAGQRAGDEIYLALAPQLKLAAGQLQIDARQVQLNDDDQNWLTERKRRVLSAPDVDIIFMRMEPPVDAAYRITCQMLAFAQRAGVLVVNDPASLITNEEKLAALRFPHLCPRTLVSTSRDAILDFVAQLGKGCMVKPLDSFGGRSVFAFSAGDTNLAVAVDLLLSSGKTVLVQERLSAISEGDRRVHVVNGKAFADMIIRTPASGSHLGNLRAGGDGKVMPLEDAEQAVVNAIETYLQEAGILFAGIDIIGGKLTEINITCPTGLRVVREQSGNDPAAHITACARQKASEAA